MKAGKILVSVRISLKDFLPVLIITVNTFTWYGCMYTFLPKFVDTIQISSNGKFLVLTLFFLGMASGTFLGATLSITMFRVFFSFWITANSILTLLLTFMTTAPPIVSILFALLLGIFTGLGFPSCLAIFAEATNVNNRGKYGGIVWGISGVCTLLIAFIASGVNPTFQILILSLWRGLGLASLISMKKERISKYHVPSYSILIKNKSVTLYLLPWIMFCLVNWIEAPIVENLFGQDFFFSMVFVQFSLTGVFAVLGGLLSDIFGRKRIVIIGFMFIGIEYALLGLFSNLLIIRYIFIYIDSIVWGIFAVVFFMTVWGDLAEDRKKERYYLFGGLPYLLAGYLSILIKPFVASIRIDAAFSLASFFLFLAVIPLMYAPETLPEKAIRERELRSYIEKAKKIKEKFT